MLQSDAFNASRIQTVVAVVLTSNLRLLEAPGNVLIKGRDAGLPKDSVANVSQIVTLDRAMLTDRAGGLGSEAMGTVSRGIRLVLGL